MGFASKLAPTGQFFGIEHVLIPPKLTLVNGYIESARYLLIYYRQTEPVRCGKIDTYEQTLTGFIP